MIDRLYGRETDDEILFADPASVYEAWSQDQECDADVNSFEIIEWSTRPNRELLPTVENMIDDLLERHVADELPDGYGYEQWEKAANVPDIKALFGEALDKIASSVAYSLADKELRRLKVTWDETGEPLLDGEPMYRKAQ